MRSYMSRDRIGVRSYLIGIAVALACCGCALGALSDSGQADAQGSTHPAGLRQVTVLVDGGVVSLSTSAATVDHLLRLLGITLHPLDRTHPAPGQPVSDGLQVRVTRVARRELVEESVLPSRTVVLAEPEMPAGYTKILAHGANGLVRRVWRIWERDGEETCRGVLSQQLVRKPTDTVVLRGTYGAPTRGGNWRRPLIMTATAYDPGPRSCGRYADGYTATGVKAERGVVAVDDRVIPMGARLYIPGYGFAVAADRGSAIKGRRIDLCFPTYWEARQ